MPMNPYLTNTKRLTQLCKLIRDTNILLCIDPTYYMHISRTMNHNFLESNQSPLLDPIFPFDINETKLDSKVIDYYFSEFLETKNFFEEMNEIMSQMNQPSITTNEQKSLETKWQSRINQLES